MYIGLYRFQVHQHRQLRLEQDHYQIDHLIHHHQYLLHQLLQVEN